MRRLVILLTRYGIEIILRYLVCCIYHKPKNFDESSDEDSSDSDSDSSADSGRARPSSNSRHNHTHHNHHHPHREGGPSEGQQTREGGGGVVHELKDPEDDRNAYEVMPGRPRKGKGRIED